MKRWILVALIAAVAQGCVGLGAYKELEGKHSHLLDVKEQWESEQSELSRRVQDTWLAYQRSMVDQGTFKSQMELALLSLRAVKSDVQILSPKVEGQGTTIKEQLQQYTALRDQFTQVMSQVATLAETNTMLANRVEQLTKLTKQTALRVAEAKKRPPTVASIKPSTIPDHSGGPGSTEPTGTRLNAVPGLDTSSDPPVALVPQVVSIPPVPEPVLAGERLDTTVSLPTDNAASVKPAPTAPISRWQQFKDLFGLGGLPLKKSPEPSASTVSSEPPAVTGSSSPGEALAAVPRSRALSTISSHPGIPAPGAVIHVPPLPQP